MLAITFCFFRKMINIIKWNAKLGKKLRNLHYLNKGYSGMSI